MGDYVRERITFSTTPDVRVPAFVLVPKTASATRRAPAIVALHDPKVARAVERFRSQQTAQVLADPDPRATATSKPRARSKR